jgi:Bacterial surface proteins containing Ig-like domains
MKKYKYNIVLVILVIAFSYVLSNNVPLWNKTNVAEAATIKLNKSKIAITVGEKYQLAFQGNKSKVNWMTGNKSIAIVSSDGVVTGIKPGLTIIQARIDNKTYRCTVTVLNPTLKKSNFRVGIGENFQLTVKNLPMGVDQKNVKYKSLNEDIAVVNTEGMVTTVSGGFVNIEVTFGAYSLRCEVWASFTDKNKEDVIRNLEIEYAQSKKEIICVINNKSNMDIISSCYLEYYDSQNEVISVSQEKNISLFQQDEGLLTFDIPAKDYKYYKLVVNKMNHYNSETNQKDKITVKMTDQYDVSYEYPDWNKDIVLVSDTIHVFDVILNNESGKRVRFNAVILYYKDNKLVDYKRIQNYSELDIGETLVEKPEIREYCNGRTITADKKIVIPEHDICRIMYTAKTNRY